MGTSGRCCSSGGAAQPGGGTSAVAGAKVESSPGGKVFGGPKWKASDYRDLLSLLFLLTKTMKSKGVIALESHIENP